MQDGMKSLFDPNKSCHLFVCVWIYDPGYDGWQVEHRTKNEATPLHYATCCRMYDVTESVNASGFNNKKLYCMWHCAEEMNRDPKRSGCK